MIDLSRFYKNDEQIFWWKTVFHKCVWGGGHYSNVYNFVSPQYENKIFYNVEIDNWINDDEKHTKFLPSQFSIVP